MSEYRIQDTTLTDIADAIRSKTGSSASIIVSEMANEIESIPTGSGERNKTVQEDLGFIDLENDNRVTLPNGLVWTKSSIYKYGTEEGYNSPFIDHNGLTTQELTFTPTKNGTLTVFYTCTSESAGYDYFKIVVDGSTIIDHYAQSGTQDYTWKVLKLKSIANQTKTIVCSYQKDSGGIGGYDKAGFLISFWE